MEALGALADGAAARGGAAPARRAVPRLDRASSAARSRRSPARGARPRRSCCALAGIAADRIERGIDAARDGRGRARRLPRRQPRGRAGAAQAPRDRGRRAGAPFQLAFILLNLPGPRRPARPDRETVDLLFFPTGGGKTEAYLGLAAFAMVLRRLRNPGDERARGRRRERDHALHAAAAHARPARARRRARLRARAGARAGRRRATASGRSRSASGSARPRRRTSWAARATGARTRRAPRSASSRTNPTGKPSPIPLENCPWCGTRFEPDSFALLPDDDHPQRAAHRLHELRVRLHARPRAADRRRRRADLPPAAGLPDRDGRQVRVAAVGRARPARCSAAPTGTTRRASTAPRSRAGARRLAAPLPPPDLVIQDELHLISGPLGTMAGLYETAIEALCVREIDGRAVRPKIVASTATVRRAQDQIQALFGAAAHAGLPAARARPARLVLRADRARVARRPPGCTSASPRRAATRRS